MPVSHPHLFFSVIPQLLTYWTSKQVQNLYCVRNTLNKIRRFYQILTQIQVFQRRSGREFCQCLKLVLTCVYFHKFRHIGQVFKICQLIVRQIQFPKTGQITQTFQRTQSVLSQLQHLNFLMPLKVIQRNYPVIIQVQMDQVSQIDWCQGCDFVPLKVYLFQVRERVTGHQKLYISQVVVLQAELNYKFKFLQVTDILQLIEPKINDSQMWIRVDGLSNLLQALVPQSELGVCEVSAIHGERNVREVLSDEGLECLILNLLAALEGDMLFELVFRVLGYLDFLAGFRVDLL